MCHREFLLALFCYLICSWGGAEADDHLSRRLHEFSQLDGSTQVAVTFQNRFHGRSFLFWRHSSEAVLTEADAALSYEHETLVTSPDPRITDALVAEAMGSDPDRVRYAVFLLCLRARFVPHAGFLIQEVNGLYGTRETGFGLFRDAAPDLDSLGEQAKRSVEGALASTNPNLRDSTRIYTFKVLEDFASMSTQDLALRWRETSNKVPACLHGRTLAYSDTEQLIPLLKMSLASRGLAAAIAVSTLLESEKNRETRGEEIEMIHFIDSSVIRLRGSAEGMKVIRSVEKVATTQDLEYCWMPYNTKPVERLKYWRSLEDKFLRDKEPCDRWSWWVVALALDLKYREHFTFLHWGGKEVCGPRVELFVSRMTEFDPTFPAWEFPSTGTADDMFHPKFLEKVRRYHEAIVQLNLTE